MGKLDKLKSQIPQGSQELSTKNHLAKTEIAMSFQNEGTELTRILLRNIEFNPHNLWSCNDDDESIQQLADAIHKSRATVCKYERGRSRRMSAPWGTSAGRCRCR